MRVTECLRVEEMHKTDWMDRCWSCKWQCLALLSTVRHAAESRSYHGCLLLDAILDVPSPGHVFTKSPKGKYTTWLPPQLLCVNKHSPSLCRAGTFNTCLFLVLSVRSINYAHPWTSPAPAFPQEPFYQHQRMEQNREPRQTRQPKVNTALQHELATENCQAEWKFKEQEHRKIFWMETYKS